MARTKVPAMQIKSTSLAKLTQRTLGESIDKGRYALQSSRKAMRSAAGRSGYLKATGEFDYSAFDFDEGVNLENSVQGMAMAISDQLSQEQFDALMSMRGDHLSALYQNNKAVFEVYFNYGGISKTEEGAHVTDASKATEAQFLIDQYRKFFPGEI